MEKQKYHRVYLVNYGEELFWVLSPDCDTAVKLIESEEPEFCSSIPDDSDQEIKRLSHEDMANQEFHEYQEETGSEPTNRNMLDYYNEHAGDLEPKVICSTLWEKEF